MTGDLAHARSRERAYRPRRVKLHLDEELRAVVQTKLELDWSPEQIAHHLRRAFPDRPGWHVCHETMDLRFARRRVRPTVVDSERRCFAHWSPYELIV